jgi:hypothetical protein
MAPLPVATSALELRHANETEEDELAAASPMSSLLGEQVRCAGRWLSLEVPSCCLSASVRL